MVYKHMPWHEYLYWSPFHIDALGLVTLLGAEQVDFAIGALAHSRFIEYLPLFGAYVIASNQITQPVRSFTLYNITDGIQSTELAGWFTRWLLAQTFTRSTSQVTWSVLPDPHTRRRQLCVAAAISVVFNGFFIFLTIMLNDWYGLANATAMLVSVLVRAYILKQNRDGLDGAAVRCMQYEDRRMAKIICLIDEGKMVTMFIPRPMVHQCFLQRPLPPNLFRYQAVRWIGWFAFSVHILAIGMSALLSQIYTVVVMLVPTVLTIYRFGFDDNIIGRRLYPEFSKLDATERRMDVYVSLSLTGEEEDTMLGWGLMPNPRNEAWWQEYKKRKEQWLDQQPPHVNGGLALGAV
jgi:hypothetical protein